MKNLWNLIGQKQGIITRLEDRVLGELQPPRIQERVLPFLESGEFEFESRGDTEAETITLVQSANRQTKITQLTYRVYLRYTAAGRLFKTVLRPSPFGCILQDSNLFDFEWNFELGSTERSYANGRVDNHERLLSRESLGYVDNGGTMLFSEKNPLILNTNEFFKITVKPTLWGASTVNPAVTVVVAFQASGYRAFSVD